MDTGPLVASLNGREEHHEWAAAQVNSLRDPCVTCESVISESLFLLRRDTNGKHRLLMMLEREILRVDFNLQQKLHEALSLMRRWDGTPMSLADACLVIMSEQFPACRVLTLDRDFIHYRRFVNEPIPVLAPWS